MGNLLSLKFLEGRRTAIGIAGFAILVVNAVLFQLGILPFDLSTNATIIMGLSAVGLGGLAGKANKLAAGAAEVKQLIAELREADAASKPPQP